MLTRPPSGLLLVANGDNTQLIVYGVLLLLSVLGSILGSKKKPDEQRGRTGKPPTPPKAPRPARPGRVETPPAPPGRVATPVSYTHLTLPTIYSV